MKKKTMIVISVVLAILIVGISIFAAAADTIFVYDGYSYTNMYDDYISICGWDNSSESLSIPAQLSGYYIKEVANVALKNNGYITSVDFNSAIYMTRIGNQAFQGCSGLTGTVSLPYRITEVGYNAFQDCGSITGAEYYATSGTVPVQCFYNCASLRNVVIGDGVSSISKLAFAECQQLEYVRIPQSVTSIHSSAFKNDTNLVIYCYTDSCAHRYAADNGIAYVLIDAPEPTEAPTQAPTDEPTEVPTVEPTEAPTEFVRYVLGDVDNNDLVQSIDATWIQRNAAMMVVPETLNLSHGDVDGDEKTSIIDATLILRYGAHMDTPYAIGEWVES